MRIASNILSIAGYAVIVVAVAMFGVTSYQGFIVPAAAGQKPGFPSDVTPYLVEILVFIGGLVLFTIGRVFASLAPKAPASLFRRGGRWYVRATVELQDGPFETREQASAAGRRLLRG